MTREDEWCLKTLNKAIFQGADESELYQAFTDASIEVLVRHAIAMSDIEEFQYLVDEIKEEVG